MGKRINRDNQLVSLPVWVLQAKVEDDLQEFIEAYPPPSFNEDDDDDDDESYDPTEGFPEKDSTIVCIEVLEEIGIYFDKHSRSWSKKRK